MNCNLVFRQLFSTESCLIHLLDFILKTEQERVCWHGSFRPSKGFSYSNHKILINKLRALGLNQIVSYLRGVAGIIYTRFGQKYQK